MLPQSQMKSDLYSIPKFDIIKEDINEFIVELKGFHQEFRDCFFRSETRENLFQYMLGQLGNLERKSIEPIALRTQEEKERTTEAKVRSMQRSISDAVWKDEEILNKYCSMVNEDMGYSEGVLIFDESAFIKKGNDSVAVSRQYAGTAGKVDNCQVGVFAAYASPYGYGLINKRLFIPEKWFNKDYADKREKCRIPVEIEFKTKPQLAIEMFKEILSQEILPFKYVTADSIYGNSPDFINEMENCSEIIYFVSVNPNTLCWIKKPIVVEKKYNYKGEIRVKKVMEKTEKKPISFQEIAKNINNYFWYRRKVSEGTKGPIEYEFTKRRIILSENGLPGKTVWLIIKRTIEETPTYSYYISNAPENTRLKTFVWLSGMRWAIKQCFEETKTELGMDQYEVRKYMGWNHHILMCMLGHFFLWHLKIKLGKKSTCYYYIAA